ALICAALAAAILGGMSGQGRRVVTATRPGHLRLVAAAVQTGRRTGPCAEVNWQRDPDHERQDEVQALIRCAVLRWDVPGGVQTALRIAGCESSFYWHAISPTGAYRGIFQLGDSEYHGWPKPYWWHRWWDGVHFPPVFNARANVLAAVYYAHLNGWGPWSCY